MNKPIKTFFAYCLIGFSASCAIHAQPSLADPTPFPMDGSVRPEDQKNRLPKLLKRVEPVYPAEASAQSLHDQVYVAFVVGKDGEVSNVRAFFGRYPILEVAAVEAVQKWKFTGGLDDGQRVKTRMIVCLNFAPARPSQ